ncbi:tyrosine-type recombinase/integrase [Streptomyces sp. NPDC097617]|uniref:tyrosine-type recombinase/integrase n=1 Tax=Streptomyces sp. NPDC097617 TaxID=3366091 RepID=UPI0037F163FA
MAQRSRQTQSDAVLRGYRSILRRFCVAVRDRHIGSLRPLDVEDFFYTPGGLSDSCARVTLGKYRNDLKQFLGFCHRRGWCSMSAEQLVEGIRDKSTHTNRNRYRMTRAEMLRLIACADDPRDQALITFAACTGVRISEALGMQIGDVSFQKAELYVTIPKTHQEVTYPLSSDLEIALRAWLTSYAGQIGELKRSYRLFPTYFRREFVSKGIQAPAGQYNPVGVLVSPNQVLRPIAVRAGIELEPGDGWHTIRRSFARLLYDDAVHQGHDAALRIVQAALGHKSVNTTELYLGLTSEHKQFRQMLKGRPFLTADLDPGKVVDLSERRAAGRG